MTPLPLGLLSLLGAPTPPRALTGPGPAQDAGALDFARLLEQAQGAELASGRPVTLGPGVEIDLTDDQLARLSAAADRAEAAGAVTAVALIDGEALVMDVRARTITGRVDLAAGEPVFGVDTVVSAPGAAPAPLGAPAPLLSTSSLLDTLSRRSA